MLKIGVIGAGYWGKKIIEEYTELYKAGEKVNVEVCDLVEENINYCREHFGVLRYYYDYKEMFKVPEIDAVNICSPNETHYKICTEALNANKHVLLEKPMTLKTSEAYELVKLAERRGLILSVGHIFRFNNAIRKIRDLIREGFLGDIYYLDLQWTTLFNYPGRDIITDLGPHPFDILNFLTDMWPEKVTCTAKGYRNDNKEEVAFISFEFPKRILGYVYLSWLMPGKKRLVKISSSNKCAVIDTLSQELKILEGERIYGLEVERNNTIRSELIHFLSCIQNNNSHLQWSNEANGTQGVRVVELIEAAKKSIKENRTVAIDYVKEI